MMAGARAWVSGYGTGKWGEVGSMTVQFACCTHSLIALVGAEQTARSGWSWGAASCSGELGNGVQIPLGRGRWGWVAIRRELGATREVNALAFQRRCTRTGKGRDAAQGCPAGVRHPLVSLLVPEVMCLLFTYDFIPVSYYQQQWE